jgi:hypothetical protein
MAAPRFAPPGRWSRRHYTSPDVVPEPWSADRPAEIDGFQPAGPRLGAQGPDQGFALTIAARLRDRVHVTEGESVDDAVSGSLGIALRRASMFSRAPVVHDLNIAFTIWGWFDANPPSELLAARHRLFAGVADVGHHYASARFIVDMVPESTLRATPEQITTLYPAQWRSLTGAVTLGSFSEAH